MRVVSIVGRHNPLSFMRFDICTVCMFLATQHKKKKKPSCILTYKCIISFAKNMHVAFDRKCFITTNPTRTAITKRFSFSGCRFFFLLSGAFYTRKLVQCNLFFFALSFCSHRSRHAVPLCSREKEMEKSAIDSCC